MKDKNAQLESLLEYLRAQPDDVNVDEAVSTTTPLYEQSVHHYYIYLCLWLYIYTCGGSAVLI